MKVMQKQEEGKEWTEKVQMEEKKLRRWMGGLKERESWVRSDGELQSDGFAGASQQVAADRLSQGHSMLPGPIYKRNEKEIDLL